MNGKTLYVSGNPSNLLKGIWASLLVSTTGFPTWKEGVVWNKETVEEYLYDNEGLVNFSSHILKLINNTYGKGKINVHIRFADCHFRLFIFDCRGEVPFIYHQDSLGSSIREQKEDLCYGFQAGNEKKALSKFWEKNYPHYKLEDHFTDFQYRQQTDGTNCGALAARNGIDLLLALVQQEIPKRILPTEANKIFRVKQARSPFSPQYREKIIRQNDSEFLRGAVTLHAEYSSEQLANKRKAAVGWSGQKIKTFFKKIEKNFDKEEPNWYKKSYNESFKEKPPEGRCISKDTFDFKDPKRYARFIVSLLRHKYSNKSTQDDKEKIDSIIQTVLNQEELSQWGLDRAMLLDELKKQKIDNNSSIQKEIEEIYKKLDRKGPIFLTDLITQETRVTTATQGDLSPRSPSSPSTQEQQTLTVFSLNVDSNCQNNQILQKSLEKIQRNINRLNFGWNPFKRSPKAKVEVLEELKKAINSHKNLSGKNNVEINQFIQKFLGQKDFQNKKTKTHVTNQTVLSQHRNILIRKKHNAETKTMQCISTLFANPRNENENTNSNNDGVKIAI